MTLEEAIEELALERAKYQGYAEAAYTRYRRSMSDNDLADYVRFENKADTLSHVLDLLRLVHACV